MKAKGKTPREIWTRRLPKPIVLRGKRGRIETLRDAAEFIFRLPPDRQARLTWDHAAALILKAARSNRPEVAKDAYIVFSGALQSDGWL